MKNVSTIGLDIAKNVFQVHGVDDDELVVIRRQLRRRQVLNYFTKLSPCLIGIEACGTAHYWARELQRLGHDVRLMPARYVKPYVKRNKNDAADAEAICEAVTRPTMRFVPIKTIEQQSVLMLHRTRQLFVRQRTSLINAIRSHLAEFGASINVPPEHQFLIFGRPEAEIHRVAEEQNVDVIVVGSHGRHGLALLLGSTANGVLHGATTDVLAVRVGSDVEE